MEFKRYNLLRQAPYRYEFLPSEYIALASYRAKTNHKRASRTTDRIKEAQKWPQFLIEAVIVGLVAVGAAYLTWHLLAWVLRP